MAVHPDDYPEIHGFLNKIFPISRETWIQVASILDIRTLRKGNHFAVSGRKESDFGIVLDGVFRGYIHTSKGSEYTETFFTPVHFNTPISFLGAYSALVSSDSNAMNIESLTDSKILVGNYREWLVLVDENKELSDWSRRCKPKSFL